MNTDTQDPDHTQDNSEWFDSAQLLLSEKRTALSVLRTGSAIFVLPLSVLSLLIATAKSYQDQSVIHLLLPLLIICAALIVLAIFLIAQAIRHLRHYEQLLYELKKSHPVLGKLID